MGFIEQLVALIQGEHSVAHEHMISSLLSIVTDHSIAQDECRRSELRLQPYLLGLIKDFKNDETFQVKVYGKHVFKRCIDINL